MQLEQLIGHLRAMTDEGISLSDIEKEVGVPRNNLSGFLSGKRPFPKKWQRKLTIYVEAYLKAHPPVPPPVSHPVPETPSNNAIIPKTQAIPPPGLSKAQQIRWYRENSQTLQ